MNVRARAAVALPAAAAGCARVTLPNVSPQPAPLLRASRAVRPELEKLRDLRVLCIHGQGDQTGACPEMATPAPPGWSRAAGTTSAATILG